MGALTRRVVIVSVLAAWTWLWFATRDSNPARLSYREPADRLYCPVT